VGVEAVAEGSNEEDGDQIHNPDGCEEEGQVDTAEAGVDGVNDDGTITLDTNTY